jgi:hypothetical protein
MIEERAKELDFFRGIEKYPLTFSIGAPIVGSIIEAWIWWSLLSTPEGTAIRPMLQSMQSFMVEIGSVLLGGIGSLHLVLTHKRKMLGYTMAILSLAPLVIGILFVRWICAVRHLRWAP